MKSGAIVDMLANRKSRRYLSSRKMAARQAMTIVGIHGFVQNVGVIEHKGEKDANQ